MPAFSSISTLLGAIRVNRTMGAQAGLQDLGGKVAVLISAVNTINANLSLIQVALGSAHASAVTFSSLSGLLPLASTYTTIGNFTA